MATGGCCSLIQDAHTNYLYLSFFLVTFVNLSFQRSPVAMRTPSSISRVPRGLLAVVFGAERRPEKRHVGLAHGISDAKRAGAEDGHRQAVL